ncbi:MAG: hypothetical protein CM15mP47_2600 [Methanobacteriota archaeon]|nr:MAG: hypothetical protein CM15mP47_2600 [Euryarchaeota archaeon]
MYLRGLFLINFSFLPSLSQNPPTRGNCVKSFYSSGFIFPPRGFPLNSFYQVCSSSRAKHHGHPEMLLIGGQLIPRSGHEDFFSLHMAKIGMSLQITFQGISRAVNKTINPFLIIFPATRLPKNPIGSL